MWFSQLMFHPRHKNISTSRAALPLKNIYTSKTLIFWGLEQADSHEATILRLLFEVFQRGLGFVFQLVDVHVLDVGQLPQNRLFVLLLLVVLGDHLGQLCGQLHVLPRLLDLGLIKLVLIRTKDPANRTGDRMTNLEHKGLKCNSMWVYRWRVSAAVCVTTHNHNKRYL